MLILTQLNFRLPRLCLVLSITLLLGACGQEMLPDYWLCQGTSQQQTYSKSNELEHEFHGKDPVLLEIFDGKVFQFFSTALFGLYSICPSQDHLLIFSKSICNAAPSTEYSRQGVLNKNTGYLVFNEYRKTPDRTILGKATYSCQYIGHTYNFSVFNHIVNEK